MAEEKKEVRKLSDAVAKNFELVPGYPAGKYVFKGKTIDLSTTEDVKLVAELVNQGFNVVRAKATAPTNK